MWCVVCSPMRGACVPSWPAGQISPTSQVSAACPPLAPCRHRAAPHLCSASVWQCSCAPRIKITRPSMRYSRRAITLLTRTRHGSRVARVVLVVVVGVVIVVVVAYIVFCGAQTAIFSDCARFRISNNRLHAALRAVVWRSIDASAMLYIRIRNCLHIMSVCACERACVRVSFLEDIIRHVCRSGVFSKSTHTRTQLNGPQALWWHPKIIEPQHRRRRCMQFRNQIDFPI